MPNGCTVYRGDARWLNCWRTNGSSLLGIGCLAIITASCGIGSECNIPDATITSIAFNCSNSPTSLGKIGCIMNRIRYELAASTSVCKNYARCFKKIYEEMGYSQTYTGSNFGLDGHAWNEAPTTSGTYLVDAYNNILYWCRR